MRILKTNFHNNPNLGLFGFATDSYCLLPKALKKEVIQEIEEALKVPVYQINIYNSYLIGIFCTGNEESLFLPEITWKHELDELKQIRHLKINVIPTRFTALGNNMLVNKQNCLINPDMEQKVILQLKKLGFNIQSFGIADSKTIGSCAVITNKGCLLHRDCLNSKKVENFFKIPAMIGTVNFGNPYIHSGLIANSHGYVIGSDTTGPELQRIDEALGFI